MKKLGIAFGGGGLKGLAHIGVLQVLEQHGIKPAFLSGTSIGGAIAALYASGISPFKMGHIARGLNPADYLDYNLKGLCKYLASFFIPGIKASLDGIIKGQKLEQLLYRLTGGVRLLETDIPLAIIACDINSGREVIFTNQKLNLKDQHVLLVDDVLLSEAVRASTAIPATFVPRHIGDLQIVDGGIRCIVPVGVQKAMGAEYILAVNLGQETYRQKVAGIPEIISRSLNILMYETSDLAEQFFADMIIYPGLEKVKLDEINRAGEIIRKGREAMTANIEELIKGLKED